MIATEDYAQEQLRNLDRKRVASLTPREVEILRMVAEGLPTPKIADYLGVSPATVRTHVSNILRRLEVPNRAAAVWKARWRL